MTQQRASQIELVVLGAVQDFGDDRLEGFGIGTYRDWLLQEWHGPRLDEDGCVHRGAQVSQGSEPAFSFGLESVYRLASGTGVCPGLYATPATNVNVIRSHFMRG